MIWLILGGIILVGLAVLVTSGPTIRSREHRAPGWQVRCTGCDRTVDAARAGMVRLGAASRGKRTLGFCRECRRVRLLAIERSAPRSTPS